MALICFPSGRSFSMQFYSHGGSNPPTSILWRSCMPTISLYRVDFESDSSFNEMLEKLGISEANFSDINEIRLNVEHFSTK